MQTAWWGAHQGLIRRSGRCHDIGSALCQGAGRGNCDYETYRHMRDALTAPSQLLRTRLYQLAKTENPAHSSVWLNLTLHFAHGRAEGVAVVILKRSDVCGTPWLHHRSPYVRILGIATNSDGAKAQGTMVPAGSAMSDLADMVRQGRCFAGMYAHRDGDTTCLSVIRYIECKSRVVHNLMLCLAVRSDSTAFLLVLISPRLRAGLQRQQDQEGRGRLRGGRHAGAGRR